MSDAPLPGPRAVLVTGADLDEAALQPVAARTGAHPHVVDLTDTRAIDTMVHVKVLCPRRVDTPLLATAMAELPAAMQGFSPVGEVLTPARVANDVLASLDTDDFFVLPHADGLPAWQHRVTDHAAWLAQTRVATTAPRGNAP